MKKRFIVSLLFLILFLLPIVGAVTYPQPIGYVNDFASVLSSTEEREIKLLIQEIMHNTTAEITVVSVPSLEGLDIETYTIGLATQWKVGKADVDNGLVLLVAPSEHQYRVEVGYGLEGLLPDGYVGQLGREILVPAFKKNQYGTGLYQFLQAIAARLQAKEEVVSQQRAQSTGSDGIPLTPFWILIILGFFFLASIIRMIRMFSFKKGSKQHTFFHTSFTGATGGFGSQGFGGSTFGGFGGGGFGGFSGGGFGGGGASGKF